MMRVSELPQDERPMERALSSGTMAGLSATELLTLVIGGADARVTSELVLQQARGSLRRLARMTPAQLHVVAGIGKSTASRLLAAFELGGRCTRETHDDKAPLRSPNDVVRLMAPKMEDLPVEEFHVLLIDTQRRLERDVLVSRGILTSTLVHPREVFREAVTERCSSIILVHNHPSGDPTPSVDDRAVTAALVSAGRLLDIPVYDHVIIGRGCYTSFAEKGLL